MSGVHTPLGCQGRHRARVGDQVGRRAHVADTRSIRGSCPTHFPAAARSPSNPGSARAQRPTARRHHGRATPWRPTLTVVRMRRNRAVSSSPRSASIPSGRVRAHRRPATARWSATSTRWPEGRTMMRNTAPIQVNLDIGREMEIETRWKRARPRPHTRGLVRELAARCVRAAHGLAIDPTRGLAGDRP
jgi:hypothetical protein